MLADFLALEKRIEKRPPSKALQNIQSQPQERPRKAFGSISSSISAPFLVPFSDLFLNMYFFHRTLVSNRTCPNIIRGQRDAELKLAYRRTMLAAYISALTFWVAKGQSYKPKRTHTMTITFHSLGSKSVVLRCCASFSNHHHTPTLVRKADGLRTHTSKSSPSYMCPHSAKLSASRQPHVAQGCRH